MTLDYYQLMTHETMSKLIIKNRYGTTPNALLNNPEISFRAKGLFGYIQSKPDGWRFSAEKIHLQTKDGLSTIKSALKELEDFGFLERKKYKTDKGYWNWEYHLYENPLVKNQPMENPEVKNPSMVSRLTENRPNISKKDLVIKSISNKDSEQSSQDNLVSEIIKEFEKVNPTCKTYYGNKSQRKSVENLLASYGFEKVKSVIGVLPKTNTMSYMPTITTPYQLEQKWASLESNLLKKKNEALPKSKVAFT